MNPINQPDRIHILLTALNRKIAEATELGKAIDRDKCAVFYTSAARLLEEIEGGESREVTEFRKLDGRSAVVHEDPRINAAQDNERYYTDLKEAKAILLAMKESFEWHTVVTSRQASSAIADNDIVKQAVLDLLYTEQRQHPNKATGYTAKRLMSRLGQYPRADVRLAIDFLNGERWLTKKTEKGIEHYRLASKAINKYHPSVYASKPYSAIQITGSNNLIVMGDNIGSISQVNTQGIQNINGLIELVKGIDTLSSDQKVTVIADLETIKAQLLKKKPDEGIIATAWSGTKAALGSVATLSGVADFVTKVSHFLAPYIK